MLSTVKYPVPKTTLVSKPMAFKPLAKAAPPAKKAEEAPIFLQKTYHMIETCDPNVCCWSEDGKTFIVKDTTLFETNIIPQFFKHNKFSSFVRQLNFYGFRKVKYSDSLRIDPKMEAQTGHYWRFQNDKFQKGRMDLLKEIKRTASEPKRSAVSAVPTGGVAVSAAAPARVVPLPVVSGAAVKQVVRINEKPEEVTHLKSEVQELKQRIASMTKNIDALTTMVKDISIKEEKLTTAAENEAAAAGQKRKKMKAETDDSLMLDWNSSMLADPFPALLREAPLPDVAPSSGVISMRSSVSDNDFVDELYEAFADEDGELLSMSSFEDVSSSNVSSSNPNAPDPQLMKRIEDSLSTIPKEMHEMVADRLIDAIANTKPIAQCATSIFSEEPSANEVANMVDDNRDENQNEAPISLPLAVATLRTILAEYGVSVECHRQCKNQEGRLVAKSLPVVPMHA